MRADESVVTWGHAESGGDSTAVQDQLHHVLDIQSSVQAFVAMRADGSVGPATGGDGRAVRDQLHNVQESKLLIARLLRSGLMDQW